MSIELPAASFLPPIDLKHLPQDPESLRSRYEDQGILYLGNFFDPQRLERVIREIDLIEKDALRDLAERWDNRKISFYSKNPVKSGDARDVENFVVTPYFQASTDAAHIFFEEIDGKLVTNRIGHGLHLQEKYGSIPEAVYDNPALRKVFQALGYVHPICLLSIYIPKLPNGVGSEVKPHQESTFANTDPLSAAVLWVALEDATIENACMWGLPGSNKLPLKYVSKVDHVAKRREYVQLEDVSIPEFDEAEGLYVPLEVKAGDALLFHGNFVHCSPQNVSSKSRKALTFQFVETAGTTFSGFNWIRKPNSKVLY